MSDNALHHESPNPPTRERPDREEVARVIRRHMARGNSVPLRERSLDASDDILALIPDQAERIARLEEALKEASEHLLACAEAIELRFPSPEFGRQSTDHIRLWAASALSPIGSRGGEES